MKRNVYEFTKFIGSDICGEELLTYECGIVVAVATLFLLVIIVSSSSRSSSSNSKENLNMPYLDVKQFIK